MIPAPAPMVRPAATLLLGIALSVALWAPSCSSPTYPPGNGWVSKAKPVRLPSESRWIPTWNMSQSTIIMPDNETGMHSVEEALRYGLVSYDWSNAKGIWGKHAPMDDEEYLVKQADLVVAANRALGGSTRVGVYRNTIKALNWMTSVREKLDDPAYSGWFIPFGNGSNYTYQPPACLDQKCSDRWHDRAGVGGLLHGDCGKAPCGGFVFDHRNSSFADWFVNGYIISNETILRPGVSELYLDDRLEEWGVSEAQGHFLQDGCSPSGCSKTDMSEMVAAYNANMEKVSAAFPSFACQLYQ
jgi:hypothetical protein